MSAVAQFSLDLDYGSVHESVFNGTYSYYLLYRVNAIVVYNGRTLSAPIMLADGGASVDMNMTQWASPDSRSVVRCRAPGSENGQGRVYETRTNGGRFSGGGGVGISNTGFTLNPGRAIKWSLGCSATESLPTHGLLGGPAIRMPAPAKSRFTGSKAFSIGCSDSYSHEFEPAVLAPNAHKFRGEVSFAVKFTPFPASQLAATKTRLRDLVGEGLRSVRLDKTKDCP